jgi:hypothetical protein
LYKVESGKVANVSMFDYEEGKHQELTAYLEEGTLPVPVDHSTALPSSSADTDTLTETAPAPTPAKSKRKSSSKSKTRRGNSMGGDSGVVYVASADLAKPISSSELVSTVTNTIRFVRLWLRLSHACPSNGNWKDEFAALDHMRTLAIWHPDALAPLLKQFVPPIIKNIAVNPRSSIVKNSELCLQTVSASLALSLSRPCALAVLFAGAANGTTHVVHRARASQANRRRQQPVLGRRGGGGLASYDHKRPPLQSAQGSTSSTRSSIISYPLLSCLLTWRPTKQ